MAPGKVKLGPRGTLPVDGGDQFDVFMEALKRVAVLIIKRGTQGVACLLAELFGDTTTESVDVILGWLDPLVPHAIRRKEERERDGSSSSEGDDEVFIDFLVKSTNDTSSDDFSLIPVLKAGF